LGSWGHSKSKAVCVVLHLCRYGVHGEASSILMSLLDQACGPQGCTDGDDAGSGLTEEQALEVLRKCHSELCQRFLVNAGSALEVKVRVNTRPSIDWAWLVASFARLL
jgi:hypothetical protein